MSSRRSKFSESCGGTKDGRPPPAKAPLTALRMAPAFAWGSRFSPVAAKSSIAPNLLWRRKQRIVMAEQKVIAHRCYPGAEALHIVGINWQETCREGFGCFLRAACILMTAPVDQIDRFEAQRRVNAIPRLQSSEGQT